MSMQQDDCRVLKKRVRLQDDCPVSKKKMKQNLWEKTQASCSKVFPEELEDVYGQCFDFADLELQDSCVVADLCGFEKGKQVSSLVSDQSWDFPQMQGTCNQQLMSVHEHSDPGYVPKIQNQEQKNLKVWDYEQMQPDWASSCSNSTILDQDFDFLADEFNIKEMIELLS